MLFGQSMKKEIREISKQFVRFRAETDEILHQHMQKATRNALYTSKTIQNEMIEVIRKHIQSKIMTKVK